MNIEAFLLCDCATESGGKLNVLGAFDNIFAKKMPVVHPACAVAIRIRFEKIEEGGHNVRVDVIDEDGKAIIPRLDTNITVKVGADIGSSVANLVLNIQRLKFENYGQYRIDVAIDGQVRGTLPLRVVEPADMA